MALSRRPLLPGIVTVIPSVKERARFAPERLTPVPLNRTGRSRTMVVGLEPGQAIPVHHPGSNRTMLVIEGRATLVSGDEELESAGPGAMPIADAGPARGSRADQRTIAAVVVSPPPTEADHREVMAHSQKGTWR